MKLLVCFAVSWGVFLFSQYCSARCLSVMLLCGCCHHCLPAVGRTLSLSQVTQMDANCKCCRAFTHSSLVIVSTGKHKFKKISSDKNTLIYH